MKFDRSLITIIGLIGLAFESSVVAQNDTIAAAAGDKYVISARAGGVNFAQGAVAVLRKDGTGSRLIKGDKLEIGDRVSTGADGRAEILLNPGSYLRLGGNSAFEFKTTSLDDLKLLVDRGSAILEVFAADDFDVFIKTPKVTFRLFETGVYRIDVKDNGFSTIAVWKGKAMVNGSEEAIKDGREATVGANGVTVAKFDRDDKDSLEVWSKERAKELAKYSASLKQKSMRTALMQSFLGRSWNMYNSFGLWVYDPFGRSFCFLPFGYGWNSPYGYGFGSYLGWYRLPPVIYYPSNTPSNTPPGNGGGVETGRNTPISVFGDRGPVPPYVRMQGGVSGNTRGGMTDSRDNSGIESIRNSNSIPISIPSPPPVYVPPVSGRSDIPAKRP
ncbi:MAG: FecR family protein [Acidobacteriota bacterium]